MNKAGRPPRIERVKIVSTQVPYEHYQWLLKQGSVSEVLRKLIEREVKRGTT